MGLKILTIREYITMLYASDPVASNTAVLAALEHKFPGHLASLKTIYYWKSKLRKQGLKIPLQRRKVTQDE